MLNVSTMRVDLDDATIGHISYILDDHDIPNSEKIMLVKDVITQEDKIKSSLRRFNDLLERDINTGKMRIQGE